MAPKTLAMRLLAVGLIAAAVSRPVAVRADEWSSFNDHERCILNAILSDPAKSAEWTRDVAASKANATAKREFEQKWHVRAFKWADTYQKTEHRFNVEEARRRGDAAFIGEPGEREYLQLLMRTRFPDNADGSPSTVRRLVEAELKKATEALLAGDTQKALEIAQKARNYIKEDLDKYAQTQEYARARAAVPEVDRRERERPTQPPVGPVGPQPGTVQPRPPAEQPPTTQPPDGPRGPVAPADTAREIAERWARCRDGLGANPTPEAVAQACGQEPDNQRGPDTPPVSTTPVTPRQPDVTAQPIPVQPPSPTTTVPVPVQPRTGGGSMMSKILDNLPLAGAVAGAVLGGLGAAAAMLFGAGLLGILAGVVVGAVVGYLAMTYLPKMMSS
ncbi:MAG: hypothetical protein HY078_06210 [Elusimicrobia bacterium]|nr:hypothetical protein [Elusimicrobiota bacterium]